MSYLLLASAISALLYGVFFSNSAPSLPRVAMKTAATALLTLWAYSAGAPLPIIIALALSTLGDALLGASEEKYLLPGMAAFFVAHAAYIPIFWNYSAETRTLSILVVQVLMTIGGALFVRSMMPWMDKTMRLPVLAYAIIILVMANGALRLEPSLWLATAGALAFVTSDLILTVELFRLKSDASIKRLTARTIWFLYYGGQAAIAWSFIQAFT